MLWYILYKGKARKGNLRVNLAKAGIKFFIPSRTIEYFEDDEMKTKDEEVMKNLIFISTDLDVYLVANAIDGLRSPYIDKSTGKPAVVTDEEMQRFMKFIEYKNMDVKILQDPYQHFRNNQKVRVKAGDFEGTEGYVFRMRGDRKLVISLGNMAVAISGIHHTLLEPILGG